MRVAAFDHVHIYAAEPERTMEFYERHFGAERVGQQRNAKGGVNSFLLLGGQLLVVSAFPPGMAAIPTTPPAGDGALTGGFGIAHVGINIDDVDGAVRELEAAGVPVLSEPRQGGMIRYAYVQAPDGVVIELTAYKVTGALRAALPLLAGYNKLVHAARRALVKAALPTTVAIVALLVTASCKKDPDTSATASGSNAPAVAAHDAAVPPPPVRDAGASAAAAGARMPIAPAKLELVGNSTIKALEVGANGEVKVGDKVMGTLGADGTFTRDGKVIAAIGDDGALVLDGMPADPPIRIDPEGDVFLDGELMMTIGDDGKISTVGKDGVITENVLALLDGPPEGRRSVALLLVLVSTTSGKSAPPPPTVSSGKVPEPEGGKN